MKLKNFFTIIAISAVLCACHSKHNEATTEENPAAAQKYVKAPEFNADTAYQLIADQVAFGPRVPNTVAHDKCAEYLTHKLKQYVKDVELQHAVVTAYDGTKLNITNIIGYINPDAAHKLLLVSHYDSRPWADQDSVNKDKPILAANDGASGVAVILEIARQMQMKDPQTGLILFFTDAEDYGAPDSDTTRQARDSYCLGTQYWARSLDKNKYYADDGIVLDMVGAKDARFLQEANSLNAAKDFVYKVWSTAYNLGYSNYFLMLQSTWGVIDDHVYVSQLGGIPTIDIVDYDASRPKGFAWYWHTHADDMKIIDKNTLKAVGQTLMQVSYNRGYLH